MRLRAFFVAAALAAALPRPEPVSAAEPTVTLGGHVIPRVRRSARLGLASPAERVSLRLAVKLDEELLARTIEDVRLGRVPPLTPDQFAARFGVAEKRAELIRFARANGLEVEAGDRAGSRLVRVAGPAFAVERAFGVRLQRYRDPEGREFRGHEEDPRVPLSLAGKLSGVIGLSNARGVMKPRLKRPEAQRGASALTGSGANGGLTPSDIKQIYGLTGVPQTGAGQRVGIIEFDGFEPNDVNLYADTYGITRPTMTYVGVNGQPNLCGSNQNQTCNAATYAGDQAGMLEVVLDIQLVMALATNLAEIRIYGSANSFADALDAYQQIADENVVDVLSISWGIDEDGLGPAGINAEYASFAQMAAQGQTVYAAAGDFGAYDNGGTTVLAVDDPAAQPYVSGVGGTSLSGTVGSNTETVWNNGVISGNYSAGGGGISEYHTIPSYQAGVPGKASTSMRNVPDVALNSDPNSGYEVCIVGGCTVKVGGTSAAAPLWSGFTALVNQKRLGNGNGRLGFANPTFYQLGTSGLYSSSFHDITSGNNGAGGFSAASGYDNTTGWGTFKGKGSVLLDTLSVPPAAVTGLAGSVQGISSITWTWNLASGATWYYVYDAAAPAVVIAGQAAPPFQHTGLASNTAKSVVVKAVGFGGVGAGATSASVETLALPVSGSPSVSVTGGSLAATFTACPAAPTASSCSGYRLEAAVNADFSGTVFSSATANRAVQSLEVGGLATNTAYWLRLATLNASGALNYTLLGQFSTSVVAPSAGAISNVTSSGMRVTWGQSTNPAGQTYRVDGSTASDFSGTLLTQQGASLFAATYGSLTPNTSYYFRVQVSPGGPYVFMGPQATLPSSPALEPAGTYSGVTTTGLTAAWSANGNGVGSVYLAQISEQSDFTGTVFSSSTANVSASFSGLTSNATYYARVQVSGRAASSAVFSLGSTSTLAAVPASAGVSLQTATGFTGTFAANGNKSGTTYVAAVSTSASMSPLAASADTTGVSAAFTALSPNTQYFFAAAARRNGGGITAYSAAVSTYTPPASPAAAAAVSSNQTTTALRANWSAAGNGPGTFFTAELSATPGFAVVQTSTTRNAWADFTGLTPNASYYLRVKTLSLGPPNPDTAFATLGFPATLASPPGAPGSPFVHVGESSATVRWVPVAGGAAQGYSIQASTDSLFRGTLLSATVTGGSASEGGVTGLRSSTTYHFRVGSLNFDSAANFLTLGSSRTMVSLASSATFAGGSLTLTSVSRLPELPSVSLRVPPGTFPSGTVVTLEPNAGQSLPPPRFTEGTAQPLIVGAGVELDAGGQQPAQPVLLTLYFDPAFLPAGTRFSQIRVARYDPASASWTLQPSFASTASVTAQINHFSLFAPFLVQPAGDLADVHVFPIPWKPGSTDTRFNAVQLTISNLPAGASVKVHSISGEALWQGAAGADGVLIWRGDNRFGRPVGSGTYLLVIDSGGTRVVRRAVVIR